MRSSRRRLQEARDEIRLTQAAGEELGRGVEGRGGRPRLPHPISPLISPPRVQIPLLRSAFVLSTLAPSPSPELL